MLEGSLAIAFIALAGSATSARGQGIPSLPRGDTTGAKPGTVMPQRRRAGLHAGLDQVIGWRR